MNEALEFFTFTILVFMTIILSKREVTSLSSIPTQTSRSELNRLKSKKGILFDVDGTLADSWKLGFDATLAVLKRNDIEPITEQTYHECTRYTTPHRLALHAGLEEDSEHFKVVGNRLAEEFDDLYVKLVDTSTAGFYDGIKELLTDKIPDHVKVGALTNACVAYANAVLEANAVTDRFGSIHGADDVPEAKPKGGGLLLCCKELGLDPSDCIYIGDSPSDGLAALDAGMESIGVLWGSHNEESLAKAPFLYLCSTVEELISFLPE